MVVNNIQVEAENIISIELISADGNTLPSFSAGSHIDLYLSNGLVRQYSLSNNPQETHRYQIAVLKDSQSRGGSRAVHELKIGDKITISKPRNLFPLVDTAKTFKLFAGGIGITPILCMAEKLYSIGADFELFYFAKSHKNAAFIERLKKSPFLDSIYFCFDDELLDKNLDIKQYLNYQKESHLYVCGPSGFMNFVLESAEGNGWPEDNLHKEYFSAEQSSENSNEIFDVKIASTGKIITIDKNETVISALLKNGIEIPLSCEQGICGTCMTRILDGVPEHRDMYFSEAEKALNNQFLPCCSRSKSQTLVLDL